MYDNKYNSLTWIRGEAKGNIIIGEKCWIGPFCVIDGEYDKVTLGDGVNVSSGAQILTHDTAYRCVTEGIYHQIDHSPINIGSYVYIGTNAVIMRGCTIGDHCIIAAGAVLLNDTFVPPYSLVTGVPAKVKSNIKNRIKSILKSHDSI